MKTYLLIILTVIFIPIMPVFSLIFMSWACIRMLEGK